MSRTDLREPLNEIHSAAPNPRRTSRLESSGKQLPRKFTEDQDCPPSIANPYPGSRVRYLYTTGTVAACTAPVPGCACQVGFHQETSLDTRIELPLGYGEFVSVSV